MAFELSIKQNSEGLRSDKVTERKKCAETLKNFLNGESAPSLLTRNTLKKSGITWNYLFDDVNELILKEIAKYGTSSFDNVKGLCSSLLFCIVAGANKGKAFIKCEKVTDACLLILKSNSHARAFGDVYMNLLYKYVMPCDYYLCNISPQTWQELLVICITSYSSLHCNLDEFTNLRLILLIIQNSTSHCQFVTQLRDTTLDFLKSNLYSTQDKRIQETLLDIIVLILEMLSRECHQTMCELTEYLIPHIVRFYDGQSDKKKKALFRCFEISIRIHHPEGKLYNQVGFCAHNCTLWKNCLENILEIICTEANHLQKMSHDSKFKTQNNDITRNMYNNFLQVAVLIYYQVFHNTLQNLESHLEANAAKRPRLQYNKHSTFNDLIEELHHECMPWLSVIAVYLEKYGKSISNGDNLNLLNTLESLLKTNIANVNLKDFEIATIAVLENLSSDANLSDQSFPEIESLWKSCIRCSTSVNKVHGSVHSILRVVLKLGLINKKQDINILLKLYKEKAMPVTQHSVATLNTILEKNCGKFNNSEERMNYLSWVVQNENITVDAKTMTELFLRLLSKDNVHLSVEPSENMKRDVLYDILFDSIDRCILFSDFESNVTSEHISNHSLVNVNCLEIHSELLVMIRDFLEIQLLTYMQELKASKNLAPSTKFIQFVLAWYHSLLKYEIVDMQHVKETQIWTLLKEVICLLYQSLTKMLKEDKILIERVKLLNSLTSLLNADHPEFIIKELTAYITPDFIKLVHSMLNETTREDAKDLIDVDQQENDLYDIKFACIHFLGICSIKNKTYRSQILEFILDSKMYNLSYMWDVNVALSCIDFLSEKENDPKSLELIFTLMQDMCRVLYRNPKVTGKMLTILYRLMDGIGFHQSACLRENCIRMLNGYLRISESLHYPPYVTCLLYKCLSKIEDLKLSKDQNWNCDYRDALLQGTKCNVHAVRLYSSYLFKYIVSNCTENDFEDFTSHLENMFLVPKNSNIVIKDELRNRATSVFHFLSALALGKEAYLNTILVRILEIHVKKSRNIELVSRVLNKILVPVAGKEPIVFLNRNLIFLLSYWFGKKYKAEDLPYELFGFQNYKQFIQKHMDLLVPAETLWCKEGDLEDSTVFLYCKINLGLSPDSVIETCFANIMGLCLPHFVSKKYKLECTNDNNAIILLQTTQRLLGIEKWNHILVETLPDIVSVSSRLLYDSRDLKEMLDVVIPQSKFNFHYPKQFFLAILKYIQETIGLNVVQYLCEIPSISISKLLFEMCCNILNENIYEFKMLSLHRFVVFLNNVPNDCSAFEFIYYYTCLCLTNLIQKSNDSKFIKVYCNALLLALKRLLPHKLEVIQHVIPQLMSILVFKAEEGHRDACLNLSNYLLIDMNFCLKESLDLVDGIDALSQEPGCSQGTTSTHRSGSFSDNLMAFLHKSKCWRYETLCSLKDFLKTNRMDMLRLFNELNAIKGYSEECETSLVHQIINNLIDIIKGSSDEKSKIEAQNCLAELDVYDLKTLVMRVPRETKIISDCNPVQYFILIVVQNVTAIVLDENPTIADKSVEALMSVLKYREGRLTSGNAGLNTDILRPFLAQRNSSKKIKFAIDEAKLAVCLNTHELWNPTTREDSDDVYDRWLIDLTTALLDSFSSVDNFIASLKPICVYKPLLCEKLLPSLISLVIYCSSDNYIKILGQRMNTYFQYFYEEICNGDSQHSKDAVGTQKTVLHEHKKIIQIMLEVVDFVRLQKSHYKRRSNELIETYNYLKLDYKCVAWAAAMCDLFIAAIYYGELWCVGQNGGVPPASPQLTAELNGGQDIQSIFRKCLVSIGETDAIDGCGTGHLTDVGERRRHFMRSGQFSDALLSHDIALSFEHSENINELHHGVAMSLSKSGLRHLAVQYVKTLPDSEDIDDIKYQCFMELGDWSLFVDTSDLEKKSQNANVNFDSVLNALQYSCLKEALAIQTVRGFETRLNLPLERAKLVITRLIKKCNMDNCHSVYNVLSKLHLFAEIEDCFSVKCDKLSMSELISSWQVENLSPYRDFKHIESIILQRSLMLQHAAKTHTDLLEDIVELQLKFTELANFNGRWQVSDRLVAMAKQLRTCGEVALVESQVYWTKGHKDIALSLIRRVTSDTSISSKLQAAALRQYGCWMAESKYESAREIIDKYLMKSLDVLGPNGHTETRLKVYLDIAVFADSEYKQVVSYIKSSNFENKLRCLKNMIGAATTLNSQQTMSKDEKHAMYTNTKLSNLEQAEINSTYEEKERFLSIAIKYYLLTLSRGEEDDLSVFRVISLWFENPSMGVSDGDGDADESFGRLLCAVPARKYLPVLPQLSPRLTTNDNHFARYLRDIITKCAVDHPHHTLPILFALKNSHKDKMILNASARSSASVSRATDEPRVKAARQLVTHLAENVSSLTAVIQQMDIMCNALISLANYTVKEKKQGVVLQVPRAEPIVNLAKLNDLPIPTITIKIQKNCIYTNFASVDSFSNTFELVGGINSPKKMTCRGSDGKLRTILLKGQDDLRQDAVMQQVFTIVNTLLEKDTITSKNKLLIRTYKVVPLSRRSGVLEWCEGTIPIGLYLMNAHQRYRPMDMSCCAAKKKMCDALEKRRNNQEKLSIFLSILKEFKPVFHYFFTEHFLESVTWYERRLAYTKSVATSSMVGYIMGLGDRHVQNILIDKKTAEVIHIDFGIAFDQGKALPTPETVPFRLTQDIIAGFGPCGVDGIFRRSCEKTLRLLRDHQETLLTILEVLLCDPLYAWTITAAQAKQKQCNESTMPDPNDRTNMVPKAEEDVAGLAQRALLAVRGKLSGEAGAARGVAVRGQVARLLHHAADPANLSRLFYGWQPYL